MRNGNILFVKTRRKNGVVFMYGPLFKRNILPHMSSMTLSNSSKSKGAKNIEKEQHSSLISTALSTTQNDADIAVHKKNSDHIHPHSYDLPRQVLSEEMYTSTLSTIIGNTYFPSLPALRRDTAILQARSEGDAAKAVAIRRAARILEQHQNGEENELTKLSVDEFHKIATSQDNEEFESIQKKEILENRIRMEQIYEQASRVNNPNRNNDDQMKLLASDEFNPTPKRHKLLDNSKRESNQGKKTTKSFFFFTPFHIPNTSLQQNPEDLRLMPPPPPKLLTSYSTSTSNPSNQIMSSINDAAHNSDNEKRIQPEQTRFSYQTTSSLHPASLDNNMSLFKNKSQPSSSSGYSSSTTAYSSTDLDASPLSLQHERQQRKLYLEKERQSFVNLTPVIIPGDKIQTISNDDDNEDEDEPIMTWGNVASTPLVVPQHLKESQQQKDDEDNNTLLLSSKQIDTREQLGQLLVKRNIEKKRLSKDIKSSPKTHKKKHKQKQTLLDRTTNLTPAAQSLLRSKMGGGNTSSGLYSNQRKHVSGSSVLSNFNARDRGAFGSMLRETYSSTPRSSSKHRL